VTRTFLFVKHPEQEQEKKQRNFNKHSYEVLKKLSLRFFAVQNGFCAFACIRIPLHRIVFDFQYPFSNQ